MLKRRKRCDVLTLYSARAFTENTKFGTRRRVDTPYSGHNRHRGNCTVEQSIGTAFARPAKDVVHPLPSISIAWTRLRSIACVVSSSTVQAIRCAMPIVSPYLDHNRHRGNCTVEQSLGTALARPAKDVMNPLPSISIEWFPVKE